MFAYREAYYLTMKPEGEGTEQETARLGKLAACENDLEILVGKNRRGRTGMQKLYCDVGCNLVEDPVPEPPKASPASVAPARRPPSGVTYSGVRGE